jgi:hypothetical protein
VGSLATHATAYDKPVPLQQASVCAGDEDVCAHDAWNIHPSYDVPTVTASWSTGAPSRSSTCA